MIFDRGDWSGVRICGLRGGRRLVTLSLGLLQNLRTGPRARARAGGGPGPTVILAGPGGRQT